MGAFGEGEKGVGNEEMSARLFFEEAFPTKRRGIEGMEQKKSDKENSGNPSNTRHVPQVDEFTEHKELYRRNHDAPRHVLVREDQPEADEEAGKRDEGALEHFLEDGRRLRGRRLRRRRLRGRRLRVRRAEL